MCTCSVCFVEVPLLDRVEDLLELVDEVVVVVAPLELRAERAEQRGSSRQEFEQRIAHQPSDTYLRNQADTVFVNSEGLDDLKAQVELWLNARFNQHFRAISYSLRVRPLEGCPQ